MTGELYTKLHMLDATATNLRRFSEQMCYLWTLNLSELSYTIWSKIN